MSASKTLTDVGRARLAAWLVHFYAHEITQQVLDYYLSELEDEEYNLIELAARDNKLRVSITYRASADELQDVVRA
jgi:hypothetical protein